jgi:hypothetical protein
MADVVDVRSLFIGKKRAAYRFTNVSDATGEAAVVKVDISTLVGPDGVTAPTRTAIEQIEWSMQGFTSIRLFWDHTADDEIAVLASSGFKDYREYGGLVDPASAGGTGDILLTTAGAAVGATYDITITFRLKYS